MEYYRLIRNKLLAAILILSAGFFTACGNDDIKVGSIDEENYQTPNDIFGYIINADGKRSSALVEFRDTGETELYLGLTNDASQPVNVVFKYDKTVLDAYN